MTVDTAARATRRDDPAEGPGPASRLSASWSAFARLNLGALWSDRARTLLAIVGVAVGVIVISGSAMLAREMKAPFDTFAGALGTVPATEVVEVRPAISGGLPANVVDTLRQLPGVEAAVPVVADLVPLRGSAGEAGALLLGVDCSVEALIGDFDCERLAPDASALPTEPVVALTEPLAAALGVAAGDRVTLPGGDPAGVPVGLVFPAEAVEGIGDGRVALTASPQVASVMLGRDGLLTAAEVVSGTGDVGATRAAVEDALAGAGIAATVDSPKPQLPPALVTVQAALGSVSMGGLIVGIVIAFNSVLLATERRRGVLATVWAVGSTPGRLVGGLLAEGALIGVAGGILAVPGGYLLGRFLVQLFGDALLRGTGIELAPHLSAADVGVAVAGGLVAGLLAVTPAAIGIIRAGPLASAGAVTGAARIRPIRLWPIAAGLASAAAGAWVMRAFGRGELPAAAAMTGLGLGFLGLLGAAVPLIPRASAAIAKLAGAFRPLEGLLVWSDTQRFPRLLAATVATLAAAAALAGSFASIATLAADSAATAATVVLGDDLVVSAQGLWDQREAAIDDAVAAAVAEIRQVDADEWLRAIIPSETEPRIVVGIEPASAAAALSVAAPPGVLEQLRPGTIALSTIAASRLGAEAGDTVELPTLDANATFEVAGVFDPVLADDSTVGDWVLADTATARQEWGAIRTRMTVRALEGTDTAAVKSALEAMPTIEVYDAARWRAEAQDSIARYFRPFVLNGYVIMLAAAVALLDMLLLGMLERRRERAVLHALGMEAAQERRAILMQAATAASVGAATAVAVTLLFTWLLSLASTAYYGITVTWGVVPGALMTSVAVAIVLALLSALWPAARASRLEPAAELRGE